MDKLELEDFIVNKFENVPHQIFNGSQIYWTDSYGYINCYENKLREFTHCTWIDSGASKVVLYFEDCPDYVFKIPFFGIYNIGTIGELDALEDTCNNNRMSLSNPKKFIRFRHANDGINDKISSNDYCAIESYLWDRACDENIMQFFTETTFLCNYLTCPIYISKYIPQNYFDTEDDSDKASKASINIARKKCSENDAGEMTLEMVGILIDQYGEDNVNKLLKFINKYNIFDLHAGNVGFDSCGKMKILDYSSFRD